MSDVLWQWQFGPSVDGELPELDVRPVDFSALASWADDDHTLAFEAFHRSCKRLSTKIEPDSRAAQVCRAALNLGPSLSSDRARQFFETHFQPHRVLNSSQDALVTGYFEPELLGALEDRPGFDVPVYALPEDLVLIDHHASPQALPPDLTAGRRAGDGILPYYTRQEIEEGVLAGRGLEIAWLADRAEAFVMHVQGSGRIKLPDGKAIRIGFAGKNGHPYTSVGKCLIERGELDPARASLDTVLHWIRAEEDRGRRLMWENRSYIFFRRLDDHEAAQGPHGALGVPLTPGRSLAVDPRYHRLGMPIWVSAPTLADEHGRPFERLMIAQDTGSAIRGPVRGDIFWGTGESARRIAAITKNTCEFCILIPN